MLGFVLHGHTFFLLLRFILVALDRRNLPLRFVALGHTNLLLLRFLVRGRTNLLLLRFVPVALGRTNLLLLRFVALGRTNLLLLRTYRVAQRQHWWTMAFGWTCREGFHILEFICAAKCHKKKS